MSRSKRISVSRGSRGQIKIDHKTLYESEKVLNQLDAAVEVAINAGIIPGDKRMNEISEKAVEVAARAMHAEGSHKPWERVHESEQAYWRRKARAAIAAGLPHVVGEVVGYGYFAKGSGSLTVVESKHRNLPHVFPLYAPTNSGKKGND